MLKNLKGKKCLSIFLINFKISVSVFIFYKKNVHEKANFLKISEAVTFYWMVVRISVWFLLRLLNVLPKHAVSLLWST